MVDLVKLFFSMSSIDTAKSKYSENRPINDPHGPSMIPPYRNLLRRKVLAQIVVASIVCTVTSAAMQNPYE